MKRILFAAIILSAIIGCKKSSDSNGVPTIYGDWYWQSMTIHYHQSSSQVPDTYDSIFVNTGSQIYLHFDKDSSAHVLVYSTAGYRLPVSDTVKCSIINDNILHIPFKSPMQFSNNNDSYFTGDYIIDELTAKKIVLRKVTQISSSYYYEQISEFTK